MTIYVIRTFRGYWVTVDMEEAELKANELFQELKQDYVRHRVRIDDVWTRIDVYESKEGFAKPFEYKEIYWHNKLKKYNG